VQGAIKRTENISDNIKKRNLDKKESISMSKEFFAKRKDLQRRREKEELLEAGGVLGILRSSQRSIRKTTKGFLGRILEFVGKLILGWAILNLPKIIKITQDVIKRMQKYFSILTKFVTDIATLFTDFGSKITEIATTLLPFDFEQFNDKVKTFMSKIRNAFDQLVLNTIKTVKVLTDKSERQLAYDIGLGELYDRMNNKQNDNQQEDGAQEGGEEEGGDEDVQIDEKEEIDRLIQGGIEALKEKRGGELTKVDKRKIQGKEPLEIYRYLLDQEIGLYINERDGVMGFMSLEGYDFAVKNNPELLNFLKPVPVSDNPFDMSEYEASGFSDDSSIFDDLRERYYDFEGEMSDKFDSIKNLFDFTDPKKGKVNNIEIEVPIEGGNSEFNFSGLDLGLDINGDTKYDVGNFKNKALQDINN
tara:strand:+ start:101 stop:1354 length:1254 start_codon:yes stop_codon:yes gene_type:complete